MYECQFKKMKHQMGGNIYKYLFKTGITKDEIIDSVKDKSYYGFVSCDIYCPDKVFEKYENLKMPFIFQNLDLTKDHVSPPMVKLADANNVTFPRRQLCISYNASNILMNTELLSYYLEMGLVVTNIHYALEYLPFCAFKTFVTDLTKMRIDASYRIQNGEQLTGEMMQLLAKIILNASYGKLGMNLLKRRTVVFCRESSLHTHVNNILFRRKRQLNTEYPVDLYEITKIKRKQTDSIPVLCAMTILQKSKLHMLKFAHFLYEYLEENSFSILYSVRGSNFSSFCFNIAMKNFRFLSSFLVILIA